MAKEHVADYFENLYQARKCEEWTDHINKRVEEMEKTAMHPENQQPFTLDDLDELTQCLIRKLKRTKSTSQTPYRIKYSQKPIMQQE